jgi:hypothetical protein
MPGVRPTPGRGSFRQAKSIRFAEKIVWGGGVGPVGAAPASTKVNGVDSSTDAEVGWVMVKAVIVPAPTVRAVPTLAEVTV